MVIAPHLVLKNYYVKYVFNKNCTKCDNERDAGLTTPEDIERFDNLNYGNGSKWNLLDVYRPKNVSGKLPVIVSVHGGGYMYGTKETYQFYCMNLAQRGYAVVNFNYHLGPKHIFPVPVKETNMVMKWIVKNSEKYGLDTQNVMMVGDSAGAQICSQYAACVTDASYAKIMELEIPKFHLIALGLNCGIYDIESKRANGTDNLMDLYFTKNPEKVFGDKMKLKEHITKDFPPSYLISSPGDFLLTNLKPMEDLLKERGVETKSKVYGDENTFHVFHVNIKSDLANEANDDEVAFMASFIGK